MFSSLRYAAQRALRLRPFALSWLTALLAAGCSTTRHIPQGELLYVGTKSVDFVRQEKRSSARSQRIKAQTDSTGVITAVADAIAAVDQALNGQSPIEALAALKGNATSKPDKAQRRAERARAKAEEQALRAARTEVEAVVAYAPNGALFGSSSLTSPIKFGLWAYNRYVDAHTDFGRWMFRSFAESPILISNVAPQTRSKVAVNTLRKLGFFRASAAYELLPQRDPKQAALRYRVHTGPLFTLDSVALIGMSGVGDSLLQAQLSHSLLRKGEAFATARLVEEQQRIDGLLRNNGYYYFQPSYVQFHADTTAVAERVQLRVQLDAQRPASARHPWYMGRTRVQFLSNQDNAEALDSLVQGDHTYLYPRGRLPLRSHIWRYAIAHRHRQRFALHDHEATLSRLYAMGIFASLDVDYAPRDTTAQCDTLDVNVRVLMDKPYDSALEMYAHFKSNQQMGPGLSYEVSKRNAFRAAETLGWKLFGSYEWQLGGHNTTASAPSSYELGTELSLKLPRLVVPWLAPNVIARKFMQRLAAHRAEEARTGVQREFVFSRRRPLVGSTTLSLNLDWKNRAGFFQIVNFGAAYTYRWYRDARLTHELVLPRLEFNRLLSTTTAFDSITEVNPALYVSVRNQLVPSLAYSLTHQPSAAERYPLWWQLTFKEAGNLFAAAYAVAGQRFDKTDKELFGTPFAQFIKATAEARYTHPLSSRFRLAMRGFAGAVWSYGNQLTAPYAEQFYIGGANSVRGFSVRTAGPGGYHAPKSVYSYIDQTGDFKLEGNLELRAHLFGSLHGALFLDAGNVWLLRADDFRPQAQLTAANLRRIAVGTGFGLRYDLQFLVLRFDLGIGLHAPYDTSRRGFYNLEHLRDGLALHFAIGYPF